MPPRRSTPTQQKASSVTAVADHRQRLLDVRDKLTAALDEAAPAYLAGIARQLQSVLSELAALDDPDAEPDLAERLKQQRLDRLATYRQQPA